MHDSPRDLSRFLPETKVTAAGVSAAVVTVLVFVVGQFGVEVPEAVAGATVALVAAVAGWLAPHTRRPDLEEG